MRIAVDARELCGRATGVGRYLAALLGEWSHSADAKRHDWLLVAHEQPPAPVSVGHQVRVVPGNGGTSWQQWSFVRALVREKPDVVFAPGYSAPLTAPAPIVLTVHDVSYFDHPEWFGPSEGQRLRWLTRWSARRARLVLTDSKFSRGQIIRHLSLPPGRIRVIPLGIHPARAVEPATRPREPIVLYVGSIFERRHVDWLIESFDRVADRVPNARLEIVGENRTAHPRRDLEALRRLSPHADRITLRSYVDEATLADLYARASVFAFLSEYEGFGLTPLEALAATVPPVVLDTPVAREVCGEAARYVAAANIRNDLSDTLIDLLTNDAHREAVLSHAPATLAQFQWAETATATLAALEEAAGAR